jgi:hypothetical protein
MNVGCGALAFGLLVTMTRADRAVPIVVAAALLAWSCLCLHVALFFPGTSAVAGPGEPIVGGRPISLWVAGALAMTSVTGALLALTG